MHRAQVRAKTALQWRASLREVSRDALLRLLLKQMKTPTKSALLHARNVLNHRAWDLSVQLREAKDASSHDEFKQAIQELDDVSNWLAHLAASGQNEEQGR